MVTTPITVKYRELIRRLFPQGWAWRIYRDSVFFDLIEALSFEPARIEERGFDFLDEMDPNTTFEMLDNWERLLGIPDECTPDDYAPSLLERRVRVLQKLTTGGGQNEAFYILIAQQLGYDIDVIDLEEFSNFLAGHSRAGDRLSNASSGGNPTGWPFTWQINAPASLSRRFRAGQSTAGERLVIYENETLECVIRRFAPAHTTVLFSFT